MDGFLASTRRRAGVTMLLVLAAFGVLMGTSVALASSASSSDHQNHQSGAALPCQFGGDNCINIGFTEAWLNGATVDLEYSHDFFCAQPPSSKAPSRCEVGDTSRKDPPSGSVVSPIRTVVPQGFTPPEATLQCPQAGLCIDHPKTIDLSRLLGAGAQSVALPPHSHILIDDESFQSTWWPVIVVGVKNINAWNQIVSARSETAVQACQASGDCTADISTNLFLFFQVLGPGASPQGPA